MKSSKITTLGCLLGVLRCFSYSSDGMLDRTFSHMMSTALPVCKAVCVQSDGKMVMAGYAEIEGKKSFAVVRMLPNGVLDDTFGNNGMALISFGNGETCSCAQAVMIDSEGRIVAGGFSNAIKNIPHWCLARLTTHGTLDKSFFGGRATFKGTVVTTFSSLDEMSHINGLAESRDGKIIAVGGVCANDAAQFALARYNTNGSLDNTFNQEGNSSPAGTVRTQFGDAYSKNDEAMAVAIDAYGKIVVGGSSCLTGVKTFALARYNPNGSLDTSFFGGNAHVRGTVVTNFAYGETHACVKSLVIQADGKIVAGGYTNANTEHSDITHFALARYTAHGKLDASFASDAQSGIPGTLITDFGSVKNSSAVNALALQSDGKIVAGGWTKLDTNKYAALARYNSDGSLDYQFNGGGAPAGKVVTHVPGNDSEICGLAFAHSGDILAVGKNCCGTRSNGAVMQYMCDQDVCGPRITTAAKSYFDGSAIKVSGSCHSPSMMRVYVNKKLVDTICHKGNSNTWECTLPSLATGEYEISVMEQYAGGNIQSRSNVLSFVVDQHPHTQDIKMSVCGKNPVSGKLVSYGASGDHTYSIQSVLNGQVELKGADFVFNPSIDAGKAEFTYMATDRVTGCSSEGKVCIAVHEIPVIQNELLDTCNSINVCGNLLSMVKGGKAPYKIKIVENSAHGVLNTREDGSFTFVPARDFVGITSFSYQVTDANGATSPAQQIFVNVDPTPYAHDFMYTTCKNRPLQEKLAGQNCRGVPPFNCMVQHVRHGNVTLEKNGSFIFAPENDYVGMAEFEYTITDAKNRVSKNAKVLIDVQPAPYVSDCVLTAHQGKMSNGSLADYAQHGIAPYKFSVVEKTLHGNLELMADGSYMYHAPDALISDDIFAYVVKDIHGCISNKAHARITIHPKPSVSDISIQMYMNQSLKHDLKRALVDAQPPYFYEIRGLSHHGTVTLSQDGSLSFMPEQDYTGLVSIDYVIIDKFGIESDPATITITVHAPVVARNHQSETVENKAARISLADLVCGGVPPYTFELVSCDTHMCQATLEKDGTLHLVPEADFSGEVSCKYKAIDQNGYAAQHGTINLVVHPAPVVKDAKTQAYERTCVNGCLQENISGGLPPYHFTLVDQVNADVILDPSGSFACKLNQNECGLASFSYKVTDARNAESKIATVHCMVQETPKIESISFATYYDKVLSADLNRAQRISKGVAPYTYVLLTQPDDGSLDFHHDGTFTFIPGKQAHASFMYQVTDAKGGTSLPAQVDIMVCEPVKIKDAEFTMESQPYYKASIAPYICGGAQPYTIQVSAIENATIILSNDGSFTCVPAKDFAGDVRFQYQVTDNLKGSSATGNVTIHVNKKATAQQQIIPSLVTNELLPLVNSVLPEASAAVVTEARSKSGLKNKKETLTYLKRK